MNIVLCGFMGCGKTTVGKILAEKLSMKFVDVDDLIEQEQEMTISEIFEKYGEIGFRKIENETIKKVSQWNNAIVSTGGGSVLNNDNVTALKSSGKIFFLDVTADTVLARLKNNTTRPLLQRPDKEKAVNDLMNERRSKYEACADFVITTANESPIICANDIIKLYKKIK